MDLPQTTEVYKKKLEEIKANNLSSSEKLIALGELQTQVLFQILDNTEPIYLEEQHD